MEMQAAAERVNQNRKTAGHAICEIGIGVHCGEVLHGFIGSDERLEFTIIGDAVNLASRYCNGAQAGQVLISPEIYERVWRLVEVHETTISTKHNAELKAYVVQRLRKNQ